MRSTYLLAAPCDGRTRRVAIPLGARASSSRFSRPSPASNSFFFAPSAPLPYSTSIIVPRFHARARARSRATEARQVVDETEDAYAASLREDQAKDRRRREAAAAQAAVDAAKAAEQRAKTLAAQPGTHAAKAAAKAKAMQRLMGDAAN